MKQYLCVYHNNCADGFGSAWVVRKALGEENVEFYGATHNNPPPNVKGYDVIITDFSYRRNVMKDIIKAANSVTIIDHHKSAQIDLDGIEDWAKSEGYECSVTFDMDHSGVMLTWQHFYQDEEPPQLLRHIEDRDLWRFKLPYTREIQANVFSYPYDFLVWDELMAKDIDEIRQDGIAIERKHFKDISEYIEAAAREMVIDGVKVPCINAPYFYSSDIANILAEGKPFAACYWDGKGGRVFSLRSTDGIGEDVSVIAAKYGGGGHKHAAGFSVAIGWEGDTE